MVGRLGRAQGLGSMRPAAAFISKRMLGLLAAVVLQPAFADADVPAANPGAEMAHAGPPADPAAHSQPESAHGLTHADFKLETASQAVRYLADRVIATDDNHAKPFMIVDKVDAKVFLFDVAGRLRGAAPALLGLTQGDDTEAAIRDRRLADIGPKLRITPAGRFIASLGHDTAGKEVLWVDYADSIALHTVVTNRPAEHRLQRLASPMPLDHRISWGCINVPRKFYEGVVSRAFAGTQGVVYVLPETRLAREVFGFE